MNIKKNILAPLAITLGSLSVVAGTAAPILAASSVSGVSATAASSNGIPKMG